MLKKKNMKYDKIQLVCMHENSWHSSIKTLVLVAIENNEKKLCSHNALAYFFSMSDMWTKS